MDHFAKPTDATFKECIDEFTTINESEELTENLEPLSSVLTDSLQLAHSSSESDWSYINSLGDGVMEDSLVESTDAIHLDNNRLMEFDDRDTNQLSSQFINEWQWDGDPGQYGNPIGCSNHNDSSHSLRNIPTKEEMFTNLPSHSSVQNHVRSIAKSENPPLESESIRNLDGAEFDFFNDYGLNIAENKASESSEDSCGEPAWTEEEWTTFISSLEFPLGGISTERPRSEAVQAKSKVLRTRPGTKRKTASAKQNARRGEGEVLLCKECGQQFSLKHELKQKHDKNVNARKLRQLRKSLQNPEATHPTDVEQSPVATGQGTSIKVEATSKHSGIHAAVSPDLGSWSRSHSASDDEEVNGEVLEAKMAGNSYDSCPHTEQVEEATCALACIKVESANIKVEKDSFDFRFTAAWREEDSEGSSTKVESPTSTSTYSPQALGYSTRGLRLHEDRKPGTGKA
ncbi:MAG: hypothetical protein Q9165_003119 [Trypethelium subeluteriae]